MKGRTVAAATPKRIWLGRAIAIWHSRRQGREDLILRWQPIHWSRNTRYFKIGVVEPKAQKSYQFRQSSVASAK